MKTPSVALLSLILTGHLLAQTEKKPAPAAASKAPLSQAAREHIDRMKPILDGKTLDGWVCEPDAWVVKDGVMASTGAGRGVIHTKEEFGSFRLVFQIRHVSGQPDHQAAAIIFGTGPANGQKAPDAIAGVQFQVPNGSHWDYRPGHEKTGTNVFTKIPHPKFDPHEWSQVEIVANAKTGVARMAVAQPVGTKAVEVLVFKDPTAGKTGPIAWQMHNKGLFDEFKDVRMEREPKEEGLMTVR